MSVSSKIAESASRLALTFSCVGLLFGLFVMSPTGRFGGFVAMAICGAVPLLLGPRRYRAYGGIALVIGLAGASLLYGDFRGDPYYARGRVAEIVADASDYKAAVGAYWERHRAWPARIEDLGLQKSSRYVKAVALEANDAIRVIASFPPLEGKSLQFVPSVIDGALRWRCSSEDISRVLLPPNCR